MISFFLLPGCHIISCSSYSLILTEGDQRILQQSFLMFEQEQNNNFNGASS